VTLPMDNPVFDVVWPTAQSYSVIISALGGTHTVEVWVGRDTTSSAPTSAGIATNSSIRKRRSSGAKKADGYTAKNSSTTAP